jgi:hypothetical protein
VKLHVPLADDEGRAVAWLDERMLCRAHAEPPSAAPPIRGGSGRPAAARGHRARRRAARRTFPPKGKTGVRDDKIGKVNGDNPAIVREAVSLADDRDKYALYRSDKVLRDLHDGLVEATDKAFDVTFKRVPTIKKRSRATLPATGFRYTVARGQTSIKGVHGPPGSGGPGPPECGVLQGACTRLDRMNRRPRLELHGSSASPEEAAAVIAAIEQFLRDTAPPLAAEAPRPSPWVSAARLEGVERAPGREPWAG